MLLQSVLGLVDPAPVFVQLYAGYAKERMPTWSDTRFEEFLALNNASVDAANDDLLAQWLIGGVAEGAYWLTLLSVVFQVCLLVRTCEAACVGVFGAYSLRTYSCAPLRWLVL